MKYLKKLNLIRFHFCIVIYILSERVFTQEGESNNINNNYEMLKGDYSANAIKYSKSGIFQASLVTTEKGDLICFSDYFGNENRQQFFYGLKKNGRPYFSTQENKTPYYIHSGETSNQTNIFSININGKEYIISLGNYFVIYDFENKRETHFPFKSLFEYDEKNAYIFNFNNKNNYSINFIYPKNDNYSNFLIMKFGFDNEEFETVFNVFDKYKYQNHCRNTTILSCFETINKYIFCFFINYDNYYLIVVYFYDSNSFISESLHFAHLYNNFIYKGVHFTGDTGAFLYCDEDNNIVIEFKTFENNAIKNFFSSNNLKIKITNNNFLINEKISDMIKLDDKKIRCIFK